MARFSFNDGTFPKVSESVEQQNLFRWANFADCKYPELQLLYHVPNEGKRTAQNGTRMVAEGLKKGVPDLCLPVSRGDFHALYIELKATGGKVSSDQKRWLELLAREGNYTKVCYGWEDAKTAIIEYLNTNGQI